MNIHNPHPGSTRPLGVASLPQFPHRDGYLQEPLVAYASLQPVQLSLPPLICMATPSWSDPLLAFSLWAVTTGVILPPVALLPVIQGFLICVIFNKRVIEQSWTFGLHVWKLGYMRLTYFLLSGVLSKGEKRTTKVELYTFVIRSNKESQWAAPVLVSALGQCLLCITCLRWQGVGLEAAIQWGAWV